MSSKNVNHAPATTQVIQQSSKNETITVTNNSAGTVYVGTNPKVSTYPWFGTALAPGASVVIGTSAGQSVYTSSPSGPASLSITIT